MCISLAHTVSTCVHTHKPVNTSTHLHITDTCQHMQRHMHSHWWYKQLKRQGWITASWETVLQRLWGTFWREYNILKRLQTLTLRHDSLLCKELDGVKDGERWQGAEEAAGDRLKHSRGYERGQKFPAICAILYVCVCGVNKGKKKLLCTGWCGFMSVFIFTCKDAASLPTNNVFVRALWFA